MPREYDPVEEALDLFCGAGGSTAGAEASGRVKVVLAVNHWQTAIFAHESNHPNTRHLCAPIDAINPRHDKAVPAFDLLLASPECTHHSIARGGKPVDDQKRATAWHVVIWAEAKRPKWIVVENVREFLDWGPTRGGQPIKSKKGETFQAWVQALRSLGYTVDWKLLNAADYGEATKRIRLFVVARRGAGAIPWPSITHTKERWRPASEIIDWSRPCPSIFTRKRPLAEKTLRRIEIGLKKFVGAAADPFIVKMRGTCNAASADEPLPSITAGGTHEGLAMPFCMKTSHTGSTGRSTFTHRADEPLRTVTTRDEHAIVAPFLVSNSGPEYGAKPRPVTVPLKTVMTDERSSLVAPFLVPNFGERAGQEPRTHGVGEPLPAVTSHGAGGLVAPFLFDVNHGGKEGRGQDVRYPLNTITTKRATGLAAPFFLPRSGYHDTGKMDKPPPRSLEEPLPTIIASDTPGALVLPFLTEYYGTAGARGVDEPLTTVTTKHRHGLALVQLLETMQQLGVIDIGFRMLDVDELAAAQGFPAGYKLHGTKADRIKLVGNAVCPGVMRAICEAIAEAA